MSSTLNPISPEVYNHDLRVAFSGLVALPESLTDEGCVPVVRDWLRSADMSKVTELNLSNKNLRVLPREVCELTSLKVLRLSDNYLTRLPDEMTNLRSLERLVLSRNSFTRFPEVLCMIESLRKLIFTGEKIIDPNKKPNPNKHGRNMAGSANHGNALTVIPFAIGRLVNLEDLDLRGNKICVIPKELAGLRALKKLNLRDNNLVLANIPSGIRDLPNLKIKV